VWEFVATDLGELIPFVGTGNRSEPDGGGYGDGDE
jgi:hypothetical protein